MTIVKNIFKIIGIALIALIILMLICLAVFMYLGNKPINDKYYKKVKTDYELEQKYTNYGEYEINSYEVASNEENFKTYKVWYPSKLENSNDLYPVVVMVNGTGVPVNKYEATFKHLASWGFVVIGNDDANSWDGVSTSKSLDFLLSLNNEKQSIFDNKIDLENIGVSGHSQGGEGAINAVTNFDNSSYYKSIYTASTPHKILAEAVFGTYDVSKINIPYFMTAGTKQTDAGNGKDAGIAPLWSLEENYNTVSDDVMKVQARRSNADHGEMLTLADGYMTAWFRYLLLNDKDAAKIFEENNSELLLNTNWQDVKINN